MQPRQRTETNEAEIRLMGLILSQSALVGLAVGIFDAGIWLTNDTEFVNGLPYAMGAFAVQGLAYYFFKMFFEHNMQERAQSADMERQQPINLGAGDEKNKSDGTPDKRYKKKE